MDEVLTYYIYRVVPFWGKMYWTGDFVVGKGHGQWAVPQAVVGQQNIEGQACVNRSLWNSTDQDEADKEVRRILKAFPEKFIGKEASIFCCEYADLPQGDYSAPVEADKIPAMEGVPEFEVKGGDWDNERYKK